MSGIAGVINFDGDPVAPWIISSMTTAMQYRGPDGIHHWVQRADEGIAFGHCLLRTTPESIEERQPVSSDDGRLVLVMDGRVDNWLELRDRLLSRNLRLRDRSDPELVLAAYRCWGEGCLDYIDGDFAFAVWHTDSRRLFCARDALGGKPLHYHFNSNQLVFASDVHAVLGVPGVPEDPNEGVIAESLAFDWLMRDETFWQNVYCLEAGHCMHVDAKGLIKRRYWQPDLSGTLDYHRDEDYIDHYRELLTDTVRRQTRSDNNVAIEVSGGLDSSAIFATAVELQRQKKILAPGIAGYTLNFAGDERADEIAYARAVAEHLGTPVHEIAPAWLPLSWYLQQSATFKDLIGYPNLMMAAHELGAVADSNSRVLLEGTGGDEWLGSQGFSFREAYSLLTFSEFADCLASSWRDEGLLSTLNGLVRAVGSALLPDSLVERVRQRRRSGAGVFDGQVWLSPPLKSLLQSRRARKAQCPLEYCRLPGQRAGLSVLQDGFLARSHILNERYAATFGVEIRRPYYTREMVQFSFLLPERLKRQQSTNKFTHRRAMRGLLPESVLQRTTKADFGVTFDHYLESQDLRLSRDLPLQYPDWVDPREAALLYARYLGGQRGHPSWSLWNLLICSAIFPDTSQRSG